jgi:prepilin-type N-terminal cleavage/methylation domain-containing protein
MSSRSVRAFSLTELIVCISIILVLLAIALPVISRAREQGAISKSQATQRLLLASLSTYCQTYQDQFPFMGDQARVDQFYTIDGRTVWSHFAAHQRYWAYAMQTLDPSTWIAAQGAFTKQNEGQPTLATMQFWTAAGLAVDPQWFASGMNHTPRPDHLLRPIKQWEIVWSSGKGLLFDIVLREVTNTEEPSALGVLIAGFADGSVENLRPHTDASRVIATPADVPVWRVSATIDGVKGRDR